jgi:GDP-4-dehydro-6-deoxy-D-mannose reductase
MPRAIITGLKGFVGPYLAAALRSSNLEPVGISLAEAMPPHPISTEEFRIHDVDIRNREAVQKIIAAEQPEFLFHLAAISHVPTSRVNPALTYDVNVGGTLNVLDAVRQLERRPRVLIVSTGNLYGDYDSGESGFSETSPVHTKSPYAASKLIGEQLARSYVEEYGMDVVIARPFNHTGPGQAPSFVSSAFARAVAECLVQGKPLHIKTGALEPRRDFSDVRDVVRAYVLLAEKGRSGEIYNVSSGRLTAIGDVIQLLSQVAKQEVTTERDPSRMRTREIMRLGGDSSKLRSELGWSPQISFETTMRDLLDYWIEHYRKAS